MTQEVKKFRAWAVDLEYTNGDKVTAYWDCIAGVHCWNECGVPRNQIRDIVIPNKSYDHEDMKSYSDVYVVEITRTPRVEETILVERLK